MLNGVQGAAGSNPAVPIEKIESCNDFTWQDPLFFMGVCLLLCLFGGKGGRYSASRSFRGSLTTANMVSSSGCW